MRTSIYINIELLNRIKEAMDKLDLSKKEVISLLLSRIIIKNRFNPKTYKPVKYQKSDPDIVWKIEHVTFEAVFYEKALDLRRNYKFSVSWFIAFAIMNYLDEMVEELSNPRDAEKIMDNYKRNFIYICRISNNAPVFISILGYPDEEYLKKLLTE